ncbi:MAG: hypothetical protein ACFFA4_00405 [Promethearchaeota archaeon]
MVLPEYVLTGSLVMDSKANVIEWSKKSEYAKSNLKVPNGKILLLNFLKRINNRLYNIIELFPTSDYQIKVYPDDIEKKNGIKSGKEHKIFEFFNKKFKILICMDFKFIDTIPIDNIDFFIWIYHFTEENYPRMLKLLKYYVKNKNIPILASSLVSDKNCGFSTYIDNKKVVTLSNFEGILEIEL